MGPGPNSKAKMKKTENNNFMVSLGDNWLKIHMPNIPKMQAPWAYTKRVLRPKYPRSIAPIPAAVKFAQLMMQED